jgi:hypothetical protein
MNQQRKVIPKHLYKKRLTEQQRREAPRPPPGRSQGPSQIREQKKWPPQEACPVCGGRKVFHTHATCPRCWGRLPEELLVPFQEQKARCIDWLRQHTASSGQN